MSRRGEQQHNIEGAFVLVLFAVFAITVIAVLALGANSYQRLVARDNDAYNRRIITSYVAAKLRSSDAVGSVAVGGFSSPKTNDGINTLHLYMDVEGDIYDQRIYFYDGHVYELLTLSESNIEPEDGSPILEAHGLDFEMEGDVVTIHAKDVEDRENSITISARSLLNGTKGKLIEDEGGVG